MAMPTHPPGRHRGAATATVRPAGPGGAHALVRPPSGRASARLAGLDLARGVAVLSMLIAHLSPVGGPVNITQNLTAPLFALVIGASMGLRLERRRPAPAVFVADNAVRGLVLVALGVALQQLYDQIDVVLPYLGLLVVVLAPLALLLRSLPVLTLGLAAAGAVLSPLAMSRTREYLATSGGTVGEVQRTLLEWVAAGYSYRLTALLPMALGGLALATVLPRSGQPPRGYGVAALLFGSSLAAYLIGYASADGARAYSGTTAEIVGATMLAAGSVVTAFLLVELGRDRWLGPVLGPLLATGRLALTAYTLQVLLLAGIGVLRGGAPDDGWAMLGGAVVVVIGACWALDRWWGTGPLEWLLARAVAPVRRPRRGSADRTLPGGPGGHLAAPGPDERHEEPGREHGLR